MAMMPWKSAATETESETAAANQLEALEREFAPDPKLEIDGSMSDHDLLEALATEGNPHANSIGYTPKEIASFLESHRDVLQVTRNLRKRLIERDQKRII